MEEEYWDAAARFAFVVKYRWQHCVKDVTNRPTWRAILFISVKGSRVVFAFVTSLQCD